MTFHSAKAGALFWRHGMKTRQFGKNGILHYTVLLMLIGVIAICGCAVTENGESSSAAKEGNIQQSEAKQANDNNQGDDNDQGKPKEPEIKEPAVTEIEAELMEIQPGAMSSAWSVVITMKHPDENVVFNCTVDGGDLINFQEQILTKSINVNSGDSAMWVFYVHKGPHFPYAFAEIILMKEQNFIGYAVIYINIEVANTGLGFTRPVILKSVLFPQINGKYQNVSEEYIRAEIERIKDESRGH